MIANMLVVSGSLAGAMIIPPLTVSQFYSRILNALKFLSFLNPKSATSHKDGGQVQNPKSCLNGVFFPALVYPRPLLKLLVRLINCPGYANVFWIGY
jgi:hypothetical protein